MNSQGQISCLSISAALRTAGFVADDVPFRIRSGLQISRLLDEPDLWIDVHSWSRTADAVLGACEGIENLFFEAGKRLTQLGLIGPLEFLPWFLSTPELIIRNYHIFHTRMDTILEPVVEYVADGRARISFTLAGEQKPPSLYLQFLKGFLTALLLLWGSKVLEMEELWSSEGDSWTLIVEWQQEKAKYKRALEELFIEPEFFRAVASGLDKVTPDKNSRLRELLAANRRLRGLQLEGEPAAKTLEDQVATLQDRYRRLFTRLQDGVFRINANGVMLDANPAALKLLGFDSLDQLKLKAPTIDMLFSRRDAFKFRKLVASFRRSGFLRDYEVTLRGMDGSTHEMSISAFPGQDATTGEEVIEGVMHDVTDTRAMQRQLVQTHRFLEAVFLNNPAGLQILDSEGWTIRVNPQLERFFGFNPESIVGPRKFNILQDAILLETGLGSVLKRAYSGQPTQENSLTLVGCASPFCSNITAPLHLSVTAFPIHWQDDQVTHVIVSYNDITESFLLTQQLSQLQKLQTIHTLASGIAHDFNNILGAIVPNAEIISARAGSDELILKKANTIKTAAKRAAKLTSQLLSFARRSRGDMRPTDINSSVTEAIELISNAIPKQMTIDVFPQADLPKVIADPVQIQQVLINLIINARDASPSESVIHVSTRSELLEERTTFGGNIIHPGRYVTLSVADEGAGMSPEIMEQVFDPFFTTKEKGRGTGLGLSVVYGIVKNHNGFVNIESEAGQGTKFDVYLPVQTRRPGAAKETV